MKFKNIASIAAGLALASSSAFAFQGSLNDVIVGFTNTYTGATNIEIDVGQLRAYGPGTYNLGDVSSFLVSAYGAGWATSSNLAFGAAGWTGNLAPGNGDVKSTGYITAGWLSTTGTLGVQNAGAPASSGSSAALNSSGQKMTSLYNAMGDASATLLAPNVVSIPTATAASWDKSNTSNFLFGRYDASLVTQLVSFNNGTFAAADLYKFSPSVAGEFIGTLALDTAGNLSFTVIPEPSIYAAILGIATLGFVAIRRRKQSELLA